MAKLTEKQKRFCDFYLQTVNGTQSAIKAGYSEHTANEQASRLLANVNISAYIKERTEKASNSRIADIKERKEILTGYLRCLKEGDSKDALKAADILNRMDQVYVEKIEHSGKISIAEQIKTKWQK